MRIGIITPLFPPDIAEPAPYCKTLATKLSFSETVTVLLYGSLPERAGSADFTCVPKRQLTTLRIIHFTIKLFRTAKQNDVLLVQNGPSAELPTLLVSLITTTPIILTLSDPRVDTKNSGALYTLIHKKLKARATVCISFTDEEREYLTKPEIHPLRKPPEAELRQYEKAWKEHTQTLIKHIHHVTT